MKYWRATSMEVPFLSSRVMSSRLWDVIELLGPVSQKQTLRRLFLCKWFVMEILLERPVWEWGKALWGRGEVRQGCNFMCAVPVSLEAKFLERGALTQLHLSVVSYRLWEWKSLRHRPHPGWRASPIKFSEGWRWKPIVEASRAQIGKVSYESEPNSNDNKN